VISKVIYPGLLSPDKLLILRIVIVLAVYAVLIFAARKEWVKPRELLWIGAAVIFWAAGWLLNVVIEIVRPRYPQLSQFLPVSIGLIAPVIIALAFGLRMVYKRVNSP